jgi:cytochrome c oxidase subunit 2
VVAKGSPARTIGLAVVGLALAASLAGCDVKDKLTFGWPSDPVGGVTEQSQKMYNMWFGSVVAALLVGIFVWGLIFWAIIRYRKRGDHLPEQTRFNLPIEVLYTVLPILVVSVLFYYTAVAQTDVNKLSPDSEIGETVEIVAFKWNWQFNYRTGPSHYNGVGAKTVASVTGASDYIPILVVPTGEKVRFEETSNDVIHSFWVPEMLFKRDVFPESRNGAARNVFEVTFTHEGQFVGRCAELCGTYHSMMNFQLNVVSPEKFKQYLAALESGKSSPEALQAIGLPPFATTTFPFPTKRTQA